VDALYPLKTSSGCFATDRGRSLKALSLGQTLTHFGRNVNSPKNIYATAHTSRTHTGLSYKFAHKIAHFALPKERVPITESVDSDIFFDLQRQLTRQLVFNRSVLPFGLVVVQVEGHIVIRDSNVVSTRSPGVAGPSTGSSYTGMTSGGGRITDASITDGER